MTEPLKCDTCGLIGEDRASIGFQGQEWGFCSLGCLTRFIDQNMPALLAAAGRQAS